MQIVAHPSYREVAARLARILGGDIVVALTKRFPDGEVYARLPADAPLSAEPVVVGSTRPNDHVLETAFILDAVQRAGGSRPRLVVPYLAYARQDRVFEPGEAVSSSVVARSLGVGTSLVVGLDVHAPAVLGMFGVPSRHASAIQDIAHELGRLGVDTVLAPDAGAIERAKTAATVLGCPWDHLEKTRVSSTDVRMRPKTLDVRGRTVAIVDDIISTGGTMAAAAGELKGQGARRVVVAATHGTFAEGAVDRLAKSGVDDVVTTDSVPNTRARVSCADALARALQG